MSSRTALSRRATFAVATGTALVARAQSVVPASSSGAAHFRGYLLFGALLLVAAAFGWASYQVLQNDLRELKRAAPPRTAWWLALGFVCLVGLVLRAAVAVRVTLALDETWLAGYPDPIAYVLGNEINEISVNPPLYSLFVFPTSWVSGANPMIMRWTSVALGAANVPILAVVAARWLNARTGLLAATLIAVHPMAVVMGAANRAYGLSLLAVTLSLGAVARALSTGERRHRVVAGLLLGILTWVHYSLTPAAAMLTALMLVSPRRAPFMNRVLPAAVTLVVTLPLLKLLLEGASYKQAQDFGDRGVSAIPFLAKLGSATLLGLSPGTVLDQQPQMYITGFEYLPAVILVLLLLLAVTRQALAAAAAVALLVGFATPCGMVIRLATIRDVHFVPALIPVILALAVLGTPSHWTPPLLDRAPIRWLAPVALLSCFFGFAAPGMEQLLWDTDPNSLGVAAKYVVAHPRLPMLIVDGTSEVVIRQAVRAALGDGSRQVSMLRTDPLHPCSFSKTEGALATASPAIVVRRWCTLESLGIDPKSCSPIDDNEAVLLCQVKVPVDADHAF